MIPFKTYRMHAFLPHLHCYARLSDYERFLYLGWSLASADSITAGLDERKLSPSSSHPFLWCGFPWPLRAHITMGCLFPLRCASLYSYCRYRSGGAAGRPSAAPDQRPTDTAGRKRIAPPPRRRSAQVMRSRGESNLLILSLQDNSYNKNKQRLILITTCLTTYLHRIMK